MAKFNINLEAEMEKTAAAKNAGRKSAKETQPPVKKSEKEKSDDTHVQTQVDTHESTHVQSKPELAEQTDNPEKLPAFTRTLEPVKRELGTTKGKKGQKLARINMAFSDDNYYFIREESERLNMTMTEFVNELIKIYREQ